MIESNQVRNVLIITAETYSKYINDKDKSVRTFLVMQHAVLLLILGTLKKIIFQILFMELMERGRASYSATWWYKNPIDNTSYLELEDDSKNVRSPANEI